MPLPIYTPEQEPNNSVVAASGQTALYSPSGATSGIVRGKILTAGDVDVFRLSLANGDRFFAFTVTEDAQGSTDTTLTAFNPAGTQLSSDTDAGDFPANASALGIVTAASAGNHYLQVTEASGSGTIRPYALIWKVIPAGQAFTAETDGSNNTLGTAQTIGENITGTISNGSDDVFRIPAVSAGATVVAFIDDNAGGAPTRSFTLTLRDLAGNYAVASSTAVGIKSVLLTTAAGGDVYAVLNRTGANLQNYRLVFFAIEPSVSTCTTYTGSASVVLPTGSTGVTLPLLIATSGTVDSVSLDLTLAAEDTSTLSAALQAPGGQPMTIFASLANAVAPTNRFVISDDALLQIDSTWGGGTHLTGDGLVAKPNAGVGAMRMAWWQGVAVAGTWNLVLGDSNTTGHAQVVSWALDICVRPDTPLVCGANLTPVSIVNATFESTDDGFTASPLANGFQRGTPTGAPLASCRNGSSCFETVLAGDYDDTIDPLLSQSVDTRGYFAPMYFSYWQQYEVNTNDRLTASIVGSTNIAAFDYFDASLDANRAPGQSFVRADASALVGEAVTMSFQLTTLAGGVEDGWMIDDVVLQACAPAVDLSIDLTAPASVAPSGTYTAHASVSVPAVPNPGLQLLTVTFTAPSGTTLSAVQPAAPAGWTCAGTGPRNCTSNNGVPVTAGSVGFDFSVDVGNATGALVASATIAGTTNQDGTLGNNSDPATTTVSGVASPTVNYTLSVSNGSTGATAGTTVSYTIDISNAGPDAGTGTTISDAFPLQNVAWTCAGAACSSASGTGNLSGFVLNFGSSGSVHIVASGTLPANAVGTFSNTVTITPPGGVANIGASSASDNGDTVVTVRNVSVSLTNNQSAVLASSPQTYVFIVSNAGPSDAPSVSASLSVPASLQSITWTCAGSGICAPSGTGSIADAANLASGQSVTYTLQATVAAAATGVIAVTGNASVVGDPATGNNTAVDSDPVVLESTDLQVSIDNGQTVITSATTYTITVTNAGATAVTGARVSDPLPSTLVSGTWTCSGPCAPSGTADISDVINLGASASAIYTLHATAASGATGVVNTVTVTAPSGIADSNASNNTASDADTVMPVVGPPAVAADYSVTLAATPPTALPGTTVVLFAQLLANGAGAAQLEVDVGSGLTVRRAPLGCVANGQQFTCESKAFTTAGAAVYSFTGAIDAGVPLGTIISSSARVVLATADANAANDSKTVLLTVGEPQQPTAATGNDGMTASSGATGATGSDTGTGCRCGATDDRAGILASLLMLAFVLRRRPVPFSR